MPKFLCAVLLALFPTMSAWAATAPLKVLIFSKTAGFPPRVDSRRHKRD